MWSPKAKEILINIDPVVTSPSMNIEILIAYESFLSIDDTSVET